MSGPTLAEPLPGTVGTVTAAASISPAGAEHRSANDRQLPSRPPSPPTRPDTPRAVACPARLRPLIPPPNFGAIADGQLFRSAFPQDRNLDFLRHLRIRTLLVLVDTEPSDAYSAVLRDDDIRRIRVDIAPNKDGRVKSSLDSICEALLVVMDAANHPLHVHCNQGRHRTGCLIACLRRMQGWPMPDILAEYDAYASPKARDGDIRLIRDVFRPEALLDYAKRHARFDHRPSLPHLLRSDLLSLSSLLDLLASTDGIVRPGDHNSSLKSNTSSKADSGVDLSQDSSAHDPAVEPATLTPAMLRMCEPAPVDPATLALPHAPGVDPAMLSLSNASVVDPAMLDLRASSVVDPIMLDLPDIPVAECPTAYFSSPQ